MTNSSDRLLLTAPYVFIILSLLFSRHIPDLAPKDCMTNSYETSTCGCLSYKSTKPQVTLINMDNYVCLSTCISIIEDYIH